MTIDGRPLYSVKCSTMNTHAQALGKLGGLANKGKPKSEAHKTALRKVLDRSRIAQDAPKPENPIPIPKPQNPLTCCLCTSKGEHKGFYQGALSLFCSKHWKV